MKTNQTPHTASVAAWAADSKAVDFSTTLDLSQPIIQQQADQAQT